MQGRFRQLRATFFFAAAGGATLLASCGRADDEYAPDAPSGDASAVSIDASPPLRIVSLIPAATEILFAMGAGDRLVGRTRWGVHPEAASAVPSLGDGVRPSLEAVLTARPDLVILFQGADTQGAANRLNGLDIATLSLRHNTLADLERNVLALGDAIGCPGAAIELNDRIRRDLQIIGEATDPTRRVRVYYDVWADPPITIGRGSFLDSLVTLAGGVNVFGELERAAPQVGLETIVQKDPDVVVHPVSRLPGAAVSRPGERPGWDLVRAVAEGRVVTVDADLLGRLGPRIGHAAGELAQTLWPEMRVPALSTGPLSAACPG
jgi:iron complex transport system substrate-binding protein